MNYSGIGGQLFRDMHPENLDSSQSDGDLQCRFIPVTAIIAGLSCCERHSTAEHDAFVSGRSRRWKRAVAAARLANLITEALK